MSTKRPVLPIFALSQPLWDTEWASLMGHKFSKALPFDIVFVEDPVLAKVIAWNGLLTPKSAPVFHSLLERLRSDAVLLLMGEGRTLLEGHPFVQFADTSDMRVIELSGWGVLPEEILRALQLCWERVGHV